MGYVKDLFVYYEQILIVYRNLDIKIYNLNMDYNIENVKNIKEFL